MPALSPEPDGAGLPVLDRAELLQRCAGDAVLADELLALFKQHIIPDAERLADLADAAERVAVAHRLKGAALAIGARELAAVAGRIEESGSAYDLEPALQRLAVALG